MPRFRLERQEEGRTHFVHEAIADTAEEAVDKIYANLQGTLAHSTFVGHERTIGDAEVMTDNPSVGNGVGIVIFPQAYSVDEHPETD